MCFFASVGLACKLIHKTQTAAAVNLAATVDTLESFFAGHNGVSVDNTAEPISERDLTLRDAQQEVDRWIKTIGVRYFSELTNLAQLVEEVGELARQISRRFGEQSFKAGENPSDLSDEMADVLFVLICLANQTGVDLTTALQCNLDKKTKRDALRHKQNSKLTNS